jgi:hypothetical protein
MTSASKNELSMHSPAAVRPEGPVDWALAPAPRSIEQGSPKAPAVARDQIHREEVKIQKTIEIQNPQLKTLMNVHCLKNARPRDLGVHGSAI